MISTTVGRARSTSAPVVIWQCELKLVLFPAAGSSTLSFDRSGREWEDEKDQDDPPGQFPGLLLVPSSGAAQSGHAQVVSILDSSSPGQEARPWAALLKTTKSSVRPWARHDAVALAPSWTAT